MSIIQIHSKDIYDIDNQKVIDNAIDKINIFNAKKVVQDNHYNEPVYNGKILGNFTLDSEPLNDREVKLFNTVVNINNPVIYFYGSYVYADNQYYVSKVVNIPLQYDLTHKIASLLLGTNKDGTKNINYVCYGKVIKGTTNSSIGIAANTNGVAVQSWSSFAIPPINNGYYKKEERLGSYFMPTEYSKTTTNDDYTISVTAHIDIPTKDNLGTVTASKVTIDGQDYLQLDLQNILCGIRITEMGGRGTALPLATNKTALSGTISGGTYTEYIPSQVNITVYGNTIGIDLQNETITIGDGQNIMRYDGNELMQITNSPSIQETYQKIIDNWKHGKEVAELRLGISDFYDENDKLCISPYQKGYPMLIHIGDLVCPWVYGADRKDKPMSRYPNGEPKVFRVVSEEVSYDGAVWQTINILEVYQERLQELNK